MISYILFLLAGFINSILDTLTFREDRSIFDKFDWSPFQTFNKDKKFLGIVQFDPWHNIKYVFLGCLILSNRYSTPVFGDWDILGLGIAWFIGFELGWKILTKKQKP